VFGPALAFLDDLQANNNREWFTANKARYERDVRDPALQFVRDFAPRLAAISGEFRAVAGGTGSSLSRMNRDTRFSADKSPYKDWVGLHFSHQSGKDAPGFHVHLSKDDCGVGLGCWMLEPDQLQRVRERIAAADGGWAEVRTALDGGGFRFIGEALKRVPKGFPPDHPYGEDLKRKTFGAGRPFDPRLAPDALADAVEAAFREGFPLVRFLCGAMGLPT
jgi:uncharacterized protein (TIGR02453 family)